MPDFLTVAAIPLRVVEGTAHEPPRRYQGARTFMFDNSPIDTSRDEKRVLDCQVDLYTAAEEAALRAACPRGVAVAIAGDWVGLTIEGLVDIGDAAANNGEAEDVEPIWKTVSLHIEQA